MYFEKHKSYMNRAIKKANRKLRGWIRGILYNFNESNAKKLMKKNGIIHTETKFGLPISRKDA